MNNILVTRTGDSIAVVDGRHRLEAMLSAFGKATVKIDGIDATVYRTSEGKLELVHADTALVRDQADGSARRAT